MNFGITPRSLELLCKTLALYPEVEQAVVFGSRAKGNYKQGSDVDIAIKGKGCSNNTALTISAELNEKQPIPYFFDVVNYNAISSTDLKAHIDRVGKPIAGIPTLPIKPPANP